MRKEKWKGKSFKLKVGALIIGSMRGKRRELADMMERKKMDILFVQETKWKSSKARNIGGSFKIFYH